MGKGKKICLREPIAPIFEAAEILNRMATAHLSGDKEQSSRLLKQANMATIREWTESLWGANSPYVKVLKELNHYPALPKDQRVKLRMPNMGERKRLQDRDGYHCRFCGIPVIRDEVRKVLHKIYPKALPWGRGNAEQHAAFQAMWLQYDHIIPHARGGDNSLENIVITCAPCNYGRMNYLPEELGLSHPFEREPVVSQWDGLERILL